MSYALSRLNLGAETRVTEHCVTDDWDYRPLYTDGRCPICDTQAQGWPRPVPAWAVALERVQWDFVGLMVLFALFLVLAYLMAGATGILPH